MIGIDELIENMDDEMPYLLNPEINPYIRELAKSYARQVAQEALDRAAENAKIKWKIGVILNHPKIDKNSITSTPIHTP